MNRGNPGYLVKFVNWFINSTKFNNIVFLKTIFYLTIFFKINHIIMLRYFSNTNTMLGYFLVVGFMENLWK
jgi:hypothetical protein